MSRSNFFDDIHLNPIEPSKIFNETSDNISIDSNTKSIIERYENNTKSDPSNCDLLLEYSQFLVKNSLYSKAINILIKLVNIDDKNKEALRLLFYCSDHENKFIDKIRIEKNLKKIDKNNHRLFYWLSELNFENGRTDNAIKFIKKSVEIDNDNREYWKFFAYLQSVIGNSEGAFKAWKEVLRIDPSNDTAKLNMAIFLSTNGQHEEANKLFSIINTKNSQLDLDLDLFIGYYLWNCIKLNLPTDDIEKIIQKSGLSVETVIGIHNNDIIVEIYEYLGDYFSECIKFDESIKFYKKAYDIYPKEEFKSKIIQKYIELSKKHISERHINQAVTYLKNGLEFDPENETIKKICKELKMKQGRIRIIVTSVAVTTALLIFGIIFSYYYGH